MNWLCEFIFLFFIQEGCCECMFFFNNRIQLIIINEISYIEFDTHLKYKFRWRWQKILLIIIVVLQQQLLFLSRGWDFGFFVLFFGLERGRGCSGKIVEFWTPLWGLKMMGFIILIFLNGWYLDIVRYNFFFFNFCFLFCSRLHNFVVFFF